MHSAGENRSNETRIGLINLYSLVWLRQEANQYLSAPLELARNFDERVRRLLRYTTHDRLGDRLGKYCGSDASFIDKDNYARPYRPYSPEEKEEE